jgi:hypothetical protein
VPFEIDDSLKDRWDPLTAEKFWSLREGMTVHVLVAPDEMVEGTFKCGHASGSLLSFVGQHHGEFGVGQPVLCWRTNEQGRRSELLLLQPVMGMHPISPTLL